MPDHSHSDESGTTQSEDDVSRPLTRGEIADARAIFGDAVDYTQITVTKGISFDEDHFYELDNNIFTTQDHYFDDFSADTTPLEDRAILLHEIAHAFQEQNGYDIPAEMERIRNETAGNYDAGYDYLLDPENKSFFDFNIEQQATIVQDFALATRAGEQPGNASAAFRDTLPFDAFGGERAREPVVAPVTVEGPPPPPDGGQQEARPEPGIRPINADGSPADFGPRPQNAPVQQPGIHPINEDGSPADLGQSGGESSPGAPIPAAPLPDTGADDPGPVIAQDDGPSAGPSQPDPSPEPQNEQPARAEPVRTAQPLTADDIQNDQDLQEDLKFLREHGDEQGGDHTRDPGSSPEDGDDDGGEGTDGDDTATPNPVDDPQPTGVTFFTGFNNGGRAAPGTVRPVPDDVALLDGSHFPLLLNDGGRAGPGTVTPADFDLDGALTLDSRFIVSSSRAGPATTTPSPVGDEIGNGGGDQGGGRLGAGPDPRIASGRDALASIDLARFDFADSADSLADHSGSDSLLSDSSAFEGLDLGSLDHFDGLV